MCVMAFAPLIYDYIYFNWIIHRRVAKKVDEYFTERYPERWREYKKELQEKHKKELQEKHKKELQEK